MRSTGATKTATCVDEDTAISAPSPELPRRAVTIAPPCSAAFPTSATITAATKNCDSPKLSPNASSELTSDLRDERRRDGGDDERRDAASQAPGSLGGLGAWEAWARAGLRRRPR